MRWLGVFAKNVFLDNQAQSRSPRFAVIETAFCRHRDAVSLRLIRRFAKMPPPIEVLRNKSSPNNMPLFVEKGMLSVDKVWFSCKAGFYFFFANPRVYTCEP